eukprot:10613319-Alexandrium_andersonii.AAC.2
MVRETATCTSTTQECRHKCIHPRRRKQRHRQHSTGSDAHGMHTAELLASSSSFDRNASRMKGMHVARACMAVPPWQRSVWHWAQVRVR